MSTEILQFSIYDTIWTFTEKQHADIVKRCYLTPTNTLTQLV